MADDNHSTEDDEQSTSGNELREYLGLDEDDLLELLGAELLGTGPGFGPEDFERQIRFAREWLQRRQRDLREKLCPDVAQTISRREKLDAMADAAAVADALAAAFGKPSASIVAVILLRRGLASLCSDDNT
jgi:hypothetical protein